MQAHRVGLSATRFGYSVVILLTETPVHYTQASLPGVLKGSVRAGVGCC